MPTATLTFQLPEEEAEHRVALEGGKYAAAVCDLDQWLRGQAKHSDVQQTTFLDIRTRLWATLKDHGIEDPYS